MKTMAQWLKDADVDVVKKYLPRKLFHCTAGPQDGVILPLGWIWAERTKMEDCATLRLPIVRPSDVEKLEAWNTFWVRAGKPNENVQDI